MKNFKKIFCSMLCLSVFVSSGISYAENPKDYDKSDNEPKTQQISEMPSYVGEGEEVMPWRDYGSSSPVHLRKVIFENIDSQVSEESREISEKVHSKIATGEYLQDENSDLIRSKTYEKYPIIDGQMCCIKESSIDQIFSTKGGFIVGKNPSVRSKCNFKWFTMGGLGTEHFFENLDISGKLLIAANTKVVFRNCKLKLHDSNFQSNSDVIFENCEFTDDETLSEEKAIFMTKDDNITVFKNCTFTSKADRKIVTSSNVKFFGCDFSGFRVVNVMTSELKVAFDHCSFHDLRNSKALTAFSPSLIETSDCRFSNCESGAIDIFTRSIDSQMRFSRCSFDRIKGNAFTVSAVGFFKTDVERLIESGKKPPYLDVNACTFENIDGNGIELDNFQMHLHDCRFKNNRLASVYIKLPVVGFFAEHIDRLPSVIESCTFDNIMDSNFIELHNGASPILRDLTFSHTSENMPAIFGEHACKPILSKLFEDEKDLASDQQIQLIGEHTQSFDKETHKFICGKCAHCSDKNLKSNDLDSCPVCKSKQEYSTVYSDFDECVICRSEEPTNVILPCGHLCVCDACIQSVLSNKPKCPVCLQEISSYKHVDVA